MNQINLKLFTETPLLAIVIVFWAGVLSTLISCVTVEIPVIFGYISASSHTRRRGFFLAICFALGIIIGYTLLGVLFASVVHFFWHLVGISQYLYLCLGILLIMVGISLSGLINAHLFRHKHFSQINFKSADYLGAILFGVFFAFLEMPSCPLCGPLFFIIAGLVAPQGLTWYSFIIFLSFALGQGLPALLIGISTSYARHWWPRLSDKFARELALFGGSILIYMGLFFLLIS